MFSSVMRSLPGALKLADVLSPAYYQIFGFISTSLIVASSLSPAAVYPITAGLGPLYLETSPTKTQTVSTPTAWTSLDCSSACAAALTILFILASTTGAYLVLGRGDSNKPRRGVYIRRACSAGHSASGEQRDNGDSNSNNQPSGSGSGSGGDPSNPAPAAGNYSVDSQRPAGQQGSSAGGPPPPPPPSGSGMEQEQRPFNLDFHALFILALLGYILAQFINLCLNLRKLFSIKQQLESLPDIPKYLDEDGCIVPSQVQLRNSTHGEIRESYHYDYGVSPAGFNLFSETVQDLLILQENWLKMMAVHNTPRVCYKYEYEYWRRETPITFCQLNTAYVAQDRFRDELQESWYSTLEETTRDTAHILATLVATVLYYTLTKLSGWKTDNLWAWFRGLCVPGLIVRAMFSRTRGKPAETTSHDYAIEEAESALQDDLELHAPQEELTDDLRQEPTVTARAASPQQAPSITAAQPANTSSDDNAVEEAGNAELEGSELHAPLQAADDLPQTSADTAATTASLQQAASVTGDQPASDDNAVEEGETAQQEDSELLAPVQELADDLPQVPTFTPRAASPQQVASVTGEQAADTTSDSDAIEEAGNAHQEDSEQLAPVQEVLQEPTESAVTPRPASPQQTASVQTAPETLPRRSLQSSMWATAEPERVEDVEDAQGEDSQQERPPRSLNAPPYRKIRRGGRRMRKKNNSEQETADEPVGATGQEPTA